MKSHVVRQDPVKALRRLVEACVTQKAAAEKLGVSQTHLSDLLRGRRTFSEATLSKLGLRRDTVKL
jgi:plasmid maintenance system antidote protein VapI